MKLASLNLSKTRLGEKTGRAFADALGANRTLETLDLGSNEPGTQLRNSLPSGLCVHLSLPWRSGKRSVSRLLFSGVGGRLEVLAAKTASEVERPPFGRRGGPRGRPRPERDAAHPHPQVISIQDMQMTPFF